MVFQKPNPFPKSIYNNVAWGARINGYRGDMDELVERSLRRAALWDEVKNKLHRSGLELSGGQQQRLCIARTLAVEPEVILMDEPCSALDPISTARVEDLMDDLKNDYTIVIVTHNMQQARRVSDMTACLMLDETVAAETTAPASSPSSARPTCSSPTPKTSAPRRTSPAGSAKAARWTLPCHDAGNRLPDRYPASDRHRLVHGVRGGRSPPISPQPLFRERWVYCSTNLLVDKNVDRVLDLIERAHRSGYTAIMLSDYKFQILDRMDERYFRNAERVKTAAAARGSGDHSVRLFRSATATASWPMIRTLPRASRHATSPTVARRRRRAPAAARRLRSATAASSRPSGDKFASFSFQDDPGRSTIADSQVVHAGRLSCRIEPGKNKEAGGNARVVQQVKVRPHACYRLSCWVKTRDLAPTGSFHLLALGTARTAVRSPFTRADSSRPPTGRRSRSSSTAGSDRGQPLRRLLGRGHRDLLDRRSQARRAVAGQRPAAQGLPA